MSALHFAGPKLKLQRARHHIEALEQEVKAFIERHALYFVVFGHSTMSQHIATHHIPIPTPEAPAMWSAIVGDAIHNLRTSLDHLANDLVRMNTGKNIEGVQFPFCKKPADLEQVITARRLNQAAPGVVDIVRSLKPYDGGSRDLRDLHDLDIEDKHRGLVVVYAEVPRSSPPIYTGSGDAALVAGWSGGVSSVDVGASKSHYSPGDKIPMHVEMVFGPGLRGDEPVVPTLHTLSTLVEGIISTFEAHCYPG